MTSTSNDSRLPRGKIAAVVVTRNRKALLERCVGALRTQSHPLDTIIVIDNDSSDGTRVWLSLQADICVICQGNEGSGGGQATGIAKAVDTDHQWIWCMDDDGMPTRDALKELIPFMDYFYHEALWINSLVCDIADPSFLAFELPGVSNRTSEVMQMGRLVGWSSPFNGTLISRNVVRRVGLPSTQLFIWGEEMEYMRRAAANGGIVMTATKSHFLHPKSRAVDIWNTPDNQLWKFYYLVRNVGAQTLADGSIRLNRGESIGHALRLYRDLGSHLRPWNWRHAFRRWWIVTRAVLAALRNDLRRRYI